MPHFNVYESDGVTLTVRFVCQRCGCTKIENLVDVDKDKESYGNLHSLNKPEGWEKLHLYGPLLCPECVRAYVAFMRKETTQ